MKDFEEFIEKSTKLGEELSVDSAAGEKSVFTAACPTAMRDEHIISYTCDSRKVTSHFVSTAS